VEGFSFPLIRKRHIWDSLSDAPYRLCLWAEQVGRRGISAACWRKEREAAEEVGRRMRSAGDVQEVGDDGQHVEVE
jgi:hypothetical protein